MATAKPKIKAKAAPALPFDDWASTGFKGWKTLKALGAEINLIMSEKGTRITKIEMGGAEFYTVKAALDSASALSEMFTTRDEDKKILLGLQNAAGLASVVEVLVLDPKTVLPTGQFKSNSYQVSQLLAQAARLKDSISRGARMDIAGKFANFVEGITSLEVMSLNWIAMYVAALNEFVTGSTTGKDVGTLKNLKSTLMIPAWFLRKVGAVQEKATEMTSLFRFFWKGEPSKDFSLTWYEIVYMKDESWFKMVHSTMPALFDVLQKPASWNHALSSAYGLTFTGNMPTVTSYDGVLREPIVVAPWFGIQHFAAEYKIGSVTSESYMPIFKDGDKEKTRDRESFRAIIGIVRYARACYEALAGRPAYNLRFAEFQRNFFKSPENYKSWLESGDIATELPKRIDMEKWIKHVNGLRLFKPTGTKQRGSRMDPEGTDVILILRADMGEIDVVESTSTAIFESSTHGLVLKIDNEVDPEDLGVAKTAAQKIEDPAAKAAELKRIEEATGRPKRRGTVVLGDEAIPFGVVNLFSKVDKYYRAPELIKPGILAALEVTKESITPMYRTPTDKLEKSLKLRIKDDDIVAKCMEMIGDCKEMNLPIDPVSWILDTIKKRKLDRTQSRFLANQIYERFPDRLNFLFDPEYEFSGELDTEPPEED